MTRTASEKDISGRDTFQDQPLFASLSRDSSPGSSGHSESLPLEGELSQINLSGGSSNLQLEQLANTNLVWTRVKFVEAGGDHIGDDLIADIESIAQHYKGLLVNAANVEPYEYLPDNERLRILEENKDIYIFENGSKEYSHSYQEKEPEHGADWKYDSVVGIQFKRSNVLRTASSKLEQLLRSHTQQIAQWSMSTNEHALAQPGNLYVKGMPKDMPMDQIVPMFSKFGPISSFKLIRDNVTGKSLGYGFVSFPLGSQASRCIAELNGQTSGSSTLFINFHIERKERERIYRDSIKESNDDEKFKGVFVGNLPIYKATDEHLTPADVIELFTEKLAPVCPDLSIASYYFPRKAGKEDATDEDEKSEEAMEKVEDSFVSSESISTTNSQNEDNWMKNYGFIKFKTHSQALKAIETLNDYLWLGSHLIVNKAVQSKSHSWHQRKTGNSSTNIRSDSRYYGPHNPYGYFGNHGNVYFPFVGSQGSIAAGEFSSQEQEGSYPMRPLSTGPYVGGYPSFGTVPHPGNLSTSGLYEGASPGGSMFPLNPYGLVPSGIPFGLPLPTRDQQESNLYVKHLPLSWKDEDLREFYQNYGEIISAKIITVGGSKNKNPGSQSTEEVEGEEDVKNLGSSRGYGFVCFKNPLDASRAIMATDGYQLTDTHTLHVSFAQKRAKSNQGMPKNPNMQPSEFDASTEGPFFHSRLHSRRASFSDYPRGQYNYKYFSPLRHPRRPTIGGFTNSFVASGTGNWAGMPMLPSGPPALSPVPFIPHNSPMMLESPYPQPAFNGDGSDDEKDQVDK